MKTPRLLHTFALLVCLVTLLRGATVEVSSLEELARSVAADGGDIRLKPGVYRMSDYLTEAVLAEISAGVDRTQKRPPVPMFVFRGNRNRIDCSDAVIEIDTTLYAKVPQGGYTRCLIIAGAGNTLTGLTIRNTGPEDRGSGGNILSVAGADNTLENVTLHVRGSFPYGYGDLLGKGGPNLVSLQKQSGIQVLGARTLLRRCKVFSRAFGHCFYIQGGTDVRVEDCYAEGVMRPTLAMLSDTSGPAQKVGFRSVYQNRDGRYLITAGYTKALTEDGFRTYGSAENVTLINCVAVNTRAGFEIGARDNSAVKSRVEGCVARGCERAFLIGSNTIVRGSRGDMAYGPLLYLRGGKDSDVEIELTGAGPQSMVHVLATIAGENHRVHLTATAGDRGGGSPPIVLGFGMPEAAEMSSPIAPAVARNIALKVEIPGTSVIRGEMASGCVVENALGEVADELLRKSPGPWNLPANGIANGGGR